MTDSGEAAMLTIIGVCIFSPFPAGLIKMAACLPERDEKNFVTTFTPLQSTLF
jgi:hypothetical protein